MTRAMRPRSEVFQNSVFVDKTATSGYPEGSCHVLPVRVNYVGAGEGT